MSVETIAQQFKPVFADIRDRSTIAERFIDRDLYRVYMATLWSNVVMSPDDAGLLEEDLEDLHDVVLEVATIGVAAVAVGVIHRALLAPGPRELLAVGLAVEEILEKN